MLADKASEVYSAIWRLILRVFLIAIVGGLLTATLVRTAPGYGMSEEQLDVRRSESSLRRTESQRAGERSILRFYASFLANYARGEFGQSPLFERPAGELIAERVAPTAAAIAAGLGGGWLLALLIGVPAGLRAWPAFEWPARTSAILLQSIPVAVLGLLLLLFGARGALACAGAVALVLYPRLVQYVINLVGAVSAMPHVRTAHAKGVDGRRVVWKHVLPVAAPELMALAGISVSMALSAGIALETILDVAGVGQLAWQAALGRDMNLLVNLTVLISIVICLSNGLAGLAAARLRGRGRQPA